MMVRGGLGRHITTLSPDQYILYVKGTSINSLGLVIGLGFVKLSVAAFLLQIGRGQKRWVRLTSFMMGATSSQNSIKEEKLTVF